MEKYTVIDLFAGAGGLSYGFMQTGRFRIVAAAEINKNAKKTYQANIVANNPDFVFIDDVVGYDFENLSHQLNGIDIVIGGPPCQGFSNANRQKNHLISMNNSLVKEYFRAIKEIEPKAFVMENVSMLRSNVHRFYESYKDNDEIERLIKQGYIIPKRKDSLLISDRLCDWLNLFEGIDDLREIQLPATLEKLLSVLSKNKNNQKRLPAYLDKKGRSIIREIIDYKNKFPEPSVAQRNILSLLDRILHAVQIYDVSLCSEELDVVVRLQKVVSAMLEIRENELIGEYRTDENGGLYFDVNSYSVIDYINAILGDLYIQKGNTINAEWFGVPQERRRFIVVGVRKDVFSKNEILLPTNTRENKVVTVGEAISDLKEYPVSYETSHKEITYNKNDNLSEYARLMRQKGTGVNNHITTKTTDVALQRFKAIQQGKNFHSLEPALKNTYSKPERTQNTIYLRLDPSKPSGTVVNVRKSMWIHPDLDRAITIREAARLQSFPDEFVFVGSKDSQYQQIGNAVPPLLAKGIAYKVLDNIE